MISLSLVYLPNSSDNCAVMISSRVSEFSAMLQNSLDFWSNTSEIVSTLKTFDDTTPFHYVSIISELLNTHIVWITLLTAFDLLVVIPANILTVVVIFRSKDLWTPGNFVLSINGVVQAIGSAIYLIIRCTGFTILPINVNYKEELYMAGWWTFSIMMRTGNNRLVTRKCTFVIYLNLNFSYSVSIKN